MSENTESQTPETTPETTTEAPAATLPLSKNPIAHGTGRRKAATARVYFRHGTGKITINGRDFEDYFPRATSRMDMVSPFVLTETEGKYDVQVNVKGGGLTGQAGAVRHGITRALIALNEAYRPTLKAAGFVTRDARRVERKKYGQPGARRRFQFSKR
jgi:small subunit ribosomal protein S9